jgi:hypothetical protein
MSCQQDLGYPKFCVSKADVVTSVIVLSIWRIQDTVYHKTGWYPTHDPTWYGPKSIFLIVLEVNVASICASVPIFWPVVSTYLGAIFVKTEFAVDYEPRDSDDAYVMHSTAPFKSDDEAAVNGVETAAAPATSVDQLTSTGVAGPRKGTM